jgi:hypothetical protein
MGGLVVAMVCRYGGIYFCKKLSIYKVYVCVRTTGSVYIASLRLGGRKLPTYELMLRLLDVATMYGSVYIVSASDWVVASSPRMN